MNKELFEKYSEIKNQIKCLQETASILEDDVKKEMEDNKLDEIKSKFGLLYFVSGRIWKYPENVLSLEKQYKYKKKESEMDGSASFEENRSIAFRATGDKK